MSTYSEDSEYRKELLQLLEVIYEKSVTAITHQVMPASIVMNGKGAGITIQFRNVSTVVPYKPTNIKED